MHRSSDANWKCPSADDSGESISTELTTLPSFISTASRHKGSVFWQQGERSQIKKTVDVSVCRWEMSDDALSTLLKTSMIITSEQVLTAVLHHTEHMCMIKHHSRSDGDLVNIFRKNHRKSAQSIFWHMKMISVLFFYQSALQIFKVNVINIMLNSHVKTSSLHKDPQSTTDEICQYPAQGRGWDGITDLHLPPKHLLAQAVMQQMFTRSHEWMDSILKVKEQGYVTSVLNWRYKGKSADFHQFGGV